MFGFEEEEADALGSAGRFPKRIEKFKVKNKPAPYLQHYFWWFIHNAICHPLIAVLPIKCMFNFHDWTSRKLNAE